MMDERAVCPLPSISNSVVNLPSKLKRFKKRNDAHVETQELMAYEMMKECFPTMRAIKAIKISRTSVETVDQFDYYKTVESKGTELVPKDDHGVFLKALLERDITIRKLRSQNNFVKSFSKHHRFAIQVTFRYPFHHWDEKHVRDLFKPLIFFERDVSRISFHNRGGRFIILYCPVLLQALKAVQCVISNIKHGESFLFRDAAVVIDYFPSPAAVENPSGLYRSEEMILTSSPRVQQTCKRKTIKERKRQLALRLLREKQLLPAGKNATDQRVKIINSSNEYVPKKNYGIAQSLHTESRSQISLNDIGDASISPMTCLPRLKHPTMRMNPISAGSRGPAAHGHTSSDDPIIESKGALARHLCFGVDGDSVTDFVSNGHSPYFTAMRLDAKFLGNVPLDESLRDYDLKEEDQLQLRQRRAKEVYNRHKPPPSDQLQQYILDEKSGLYYKKCALSQPKSFYVDGDARLEEISDGSEDENEPERLKVAIELLKSGETDLAKEILNETTPTSNLSLGKGDDDLHSNLSESTIGSEDEEQEFLYSAAPVTLKHEFEPNVSDIKADRIAHAAASGTRRESVSWQAESHRE